MWPVIESYFRSISDCPVFMSRIFNGNVANANEFKAPFFFGSFTLDHFNHFNATSQTPNLPFPKLISILKSLKQRLAFSRDDEYYGDQTMRLIADMERDGEIDITLRLKAAFKKFYDDCLSYINKWSAHLENIASFFGNWLTFECRPSSENNKKSHGSEIVKFSAVDQIQRRFRLC